MCPSASVFHVLVASLIIMAHFKKKSDKKKVEFVDKRRYFTMKIQIYIIVYVSKLNNISDCSKSTKPKNTKLQIVKIYYSNFDKHHYTYFHGFNAMSLLYFGTR